MALRPSVLTGNEGQPWEQVTSEPTGSPTPAHLEQALLVLALALLFASGGGARLTQPVCLALCERRGQIVVVLRIGALKLRESLAANGSGTSGGWPVQREWERAESRR